MSPIARFLPRVAAAERVRVQHLAPALACVAAAAVVARTAGTTLLLQSFEASVMPWMYATTAVIVIAGAFGLSRLMARMRPDRVILAMTALVIAGCVAVRLGSGHGGPFAVAAYLLADLIARILVGLFWGLAALLLNPREGRRLLGIVGAAGTAACMLAGASIPVLNAALGAPNLLVVVAVLVAGFGIAIGTLPRRDPAVGSRLEPSPSATVLLAPTGANASLLREPLVGSIGMMVMAATIALFVNDFVFLSAARRLHPGGELASFLGRFYALGSMLALIVQLLVLPWLLRAGGVLAGLVLLPASLLAMSVGVAATGAFPWMFAAKLAEPVLLFTVDAAAIQLLYQGVRRSSRFRARTLVDGIARPLAIAATALALIAGVSSAPPRALAVVIVLACAAWLYAARRSAALYVRGLIDLLGAQGLDLAEPALADRDPAFTAHLREKLHHAQESEMPYLLALVADSEADWTAELMELLARDSAAVRVAVLDVLARRGTPEAASAVTSCLSDPSPAVRAAAVRAIVSLLDADSVTHLEPRLADADAEVRALAAASVVEAGDLDAVMAGSAVLRDMLHSESSERRVAVVRALRQVRRVGLGRALGPLLADPTPSVQAVALEALCERPVPALVPTILPLLGDPETASLAADALVTAGVGALAPLEAAARSPETPAAIRVRLPAVLGRLGPVALPALESLCELPEDELARSAIRAYCRVVAANGADAATRPKVERLVRREAERALSARRSAARVRQVPGTEFLVQVLDEERQAHVDDCLLLLGSLHPALEGARTSLQARGGSSDERASAVEVLHEMLQPELRAKVLPLLEHAKAAEAAGDHATLHELARSAGTEWLTAGALHACATAGKATCAPHVVSFLADARPRVRETALEALRRIENPATVAQRARALAEDPDACVRELAHRVATQPETRRPA